MKLNKKVGESKFITIMKNIWLTTSKISKYRNKENYSADLCFKGHGQIIS
jgi:hypothetical protein